MNIAYKIYCELMDLGYNDYSETLQSDLEFIQSFIDSYGVQETRKILKQYFE